MKESTNDEKLGRLLRDNWTVSLRPDPNFRAGVWARIESSRHSPSTWIAWLREHVRGVAPLALASIALAIAGGGFMARAASQHERDQLIERYVTSIDPHRQVAAKYQP